MRPKIELRALPLALALAAALILAGPAAAVGRPATSPLAQAGAWLAELLPAWLLHAWTGTAEVPPAPTASGNTGSTLDTATTTAGAENEHGHGIDPNG